MSASEVVPLTTVRSRAVMLAPYGQRMADERFPEGS